MQIAFPTPLGRSGELARPLANEAGIARRLPLLARLSALGATVKIVDLVSSQSLYLPPESIAYQSGTKRLWLPNTKLRTSATWH
jgi:hypothetical protein